MLMGSDNLEDCGIVFFSSVFTVDHRKCPGVMRSSVNCHCLAEVDLDLICAVQEALSRAAQGERLPANDARCLAIARSKATTGQRVSSTESGLRHSPVRS
jgi:hypothetical protein